MARLFALDQNFPQPIVKVLQDFQADAELVPVGAIDPRMAELDDWQLLLALRQHERPWDGLITTDSSILFQPLELAVLIQTRLTLVVALEAGHNPVKATGLLFAHLAGICKRTHQDEAQLWRLQARTQAHVAPWDQAEDRRGAPERRRVEPVRCEPPRRRTARNRPVGLSHRAEDRDLFVGRLIGDRVRLEQQQNHWITALGR